MADKPSQDIYEIDYSDDRFQEVKSEKQSAMSAINKTYDNMINQSDKFYQAQVDASKQWADKQTQLQQEQTDFTIDQIEQQKEQAKKDYTKEQSGAYVDWQKQSAQYGANAEAMAAQGMAGTGYSESSQVSMYNTYQNRVATARESYNRAVLNYDNAIKDARLQNNAALAEIAYQALQTQLELSLEGFQYKNSLIQEKTKLGLEVDEMYHNRYQDVLSQINTENAMAEEVRQFNQNYAMKEKEYQEGVRQFNEELGLQKSKLAEDKRQFNEQMAYQKKKDDESLKVKSSGRGASNSNYSKNRSKTTNKSYSGGTKAVSKSKGETNRNSGKTGAEIDMQSVLNLGRGPISAAELNRLVSSGQVEKYYSNGKTKFRNSSYVNKQAMLAASLGVKR